MKTILFINALGVSMNAQELATQLQRRKEKNLSFFATYFPSIHKNFNDIKLVNARLNLDPNSLEVNLVEHEKAIYPLTTFAFNQNEAQQFSDAFKEGSMNHPIRRARAEEFYRGRYGHGSLANFLATVQPTAEAIKPYTFGHSLPQVVFLGSGLGIHINEFLKLRDVRHAVLVEHNPNRFLASLYVTDWEAIILPYIQDQTRSFVLSVGDTTSLEEDERVHQAFVGAWNSICLNVPFMPIQTVFYIHQADPFYTKVANRLNDDIEAYINIWGYYDDEVNQLNHLFHNIKQNIPVLKKTDLSSLSKATLICGNGPSLDQYLPLIKQYRHKLHVIAAGSATHSLLKNNIIPDFMVTLESDYETYTILTQLPARAKETPIIGAAQIAPATFSLFKDSLMYLKDETSYARLFDKNHDTISTGTPSASNAALAITLDLNPNHVFLLGMDFGFLDPTKTHSESSFYTEEDKQEQFEMFKKSMADEAYKIQTNERGDVYTTPFYNTSRNHAERKIRESKRKDIINLSLGATIEGTTEKNKEEFERFIKNLEINDKETDLFYLLKKRSSKISEKEMMKAEDNLEIGFKKLKKEYLIIIKELEPNMISIEKTLFKINRIITKNKDTNISKLNMFMRGMIWHWITNYYALCKEYDAEKKLDIFTREFKKQFGGFINYLPVHFKSYLADKSFDDPKLNLSVAEAEPNINDWFNKINLYEE